MYEAGASIVEAKEGAVAHDVLHLGGDELGGVLHMPIKNDVPKNKKTNMKIKKNSNSVKIQRTEYFVLL